jgi:hypothetical protein
MIIVDVTYKKLIKELEFVDNWIDVICDTILQKDKQNCKIYPFYNYGFFVKKNSEEEVDYLNMKFKKRFDYEMSKVRVHVGIKIDDFMMMQKLNKGIVPKTIKDIVREITKVRMIVESKFHDNEEVTNSIPPVNSKIVKFDVAELDTFDFEGEISLDIDAILDKISQTGIDSLSKIEKQFLDKKSKE